jgi:putative sterol carrier protein
MATVQEFLERLPTAVAPERTAGMSNSFVFDVEGLGAWTVKVDDGTITVAEGAEAADCTLSASEETFTRIVNGDQNATTAYMTGKLKIAGDMGAALKLQKLF